MTEKKRFNLVGGYLYDGDECVSHFDDPKHREEIVNLLNKLSDENECLKSRVNYFEIKIQRERRASMVQYDKWENEALDKINELSDENEQLKKEIMWWKYRCGEDFMSEKNWDVIDKKEPRGQSVTYKGIQCTARTCVTNLNRFEKENEQLKSDKEALIDFIKMKFPKSHKHILEGFE